MIGFIKSALAQTASPLASPTTAVQQAGEAANGAMPMTGGALGAGATPAGHSVIDLFLRADIVVQSVMIALLLASVWCWAIIIEKTIKLRRTRSQSRQFEEAFWSGGSLEDLHGRLSKTRDKICPMTAMFIAGMDEWKRSSSNRSGNLTTAMQERIERVMQMTINRELNLLEKYLTFLASVGSSAPFIGLFGTVWGIMNSFASIAASKQTSLAVVAPGISEALLATALGLVAAIPATIGYNKISSDIGRYASRLENFQAEMAAIFSRQTD